MSQFLDYLRSLLPRLKREDVMEDLRFTGDELTNNVIPAYKEAVHFLKANKFESDTLNEMSVAFSRNLKVKGKGSNFIQVVDSFLTDIDANLKFTVASLEALLEHDVLKDGLTAKKANLVRAAEYFSFITRYSLDLLDYVYMQETKAKGGSVADMPPVKEKSIQDNIVNFAILLNSIALKPVEFEKLFAEMPDVVVNEKTFNALAAVYKPENLSSISSPLMRNFEGNPLYHLRLMVAEWQADRYKACKDRKRVLELRLLNLKMLAEDNQDPRLQREIDYIQSRIEGIEYKMRKMEESVR